MSGPYPLIFQPSPFDALRDAFAQIAEGRRANEAMQMAREDAALRREDSVLRRDLTRAQIQHTNAQTGALTEQAKEPQRRRMAEAEREAERNKALQAALGGIDDPKVRTGLGMVLSLGDDVPADVRSALYQHYVGDQNPEQGMRLFFQFMRTGATAGNAARAAGLPRTPAGFQDNYTIPTALSVYAQDRRRQQEISNLNAQATRLQQYVSSAERGIETARENATRRVGGAMARFNLLTPEQRAEVDGLVARYERSNFPDLAVRRAELQRTLTQFGTITGVQMPGQGAAVPGLQSIIDRDFDENP